MKVVEKVWGKEHWIVNNEYCGKLLILKKCTDVVSIIIRIKQKLFML
jgi:hypothetical protein